MALTFGGGTSFKISYGDITRFDGLGTLSVAMWAEQTTLASGRLMISKTSSTTAAQKTFEVRTAVTGSDTGNDIEFTLGDGSNSLNTRTTGNVFGANIGWTHVLCVWSGGTTVAIFINGVNQTLSTVTAGTVSGLVNSTGGLQIGTSGANQGSMIGRMAEAAIWSTALDQDAATALARTVSPLLVNPGSLIFYSPLWGYASPEFDLVSNLTGVLAGPPTLAAHPAVANKARRRRHQVLPVEMKVQNPRRPRRQRDALREPEPEYVW